jgi:hypothetical protein
MPSAISTDSSGRAELGPDKRPTGKELTWTVEEFFELL